MSDDAPQIDQPLSESARTLALAHFNHVEQQVSLATTTAALLVAADALLIGSFIGSIKEFQILQHGSLERLGFIAGGILLFFGLGLALLAVFPNLSSARFKMPDVNSLFFFGRVGDLSQNDYIAKFIASDASRKLDAELLSQIWAKAYWLKKMFYNIQLSIACIFLATLSFGLMLLHRAFTV